MKKNNKGPIIVTGAAGFIGFHVCEALLSRGESVVGFDALTPYNDPKLKRKRLSLLRAHKKFTFVRGSLSTPGVFARLVKKTKPQSIVHLAGQAGVRYSLSHPQSYVDANISGTLAVLEAVKEGGTPVVYASSSSVYGERGGIFTETDRTDAQVSIYAATKKTTELLAETYHALYGLSLTGLRFFTVYGPWMRTDLAIYKFARLLTLGKNIPLYAHGTSKRSYSHVSVIVDGVLAALDQRKPGHRIYNLGDERTYTTKDMLRLLAQALNVGPRVTLLPKQKGDVPLTRASGKKAKRELGVVAATHLEEGLIEFAQWFTEHKRFLLSLSDMHS